MPISYTIDSTNHVILETWVGDIDANALEEHWVPYLTDPAVLAIRRTLVDLRGCTILFTGPEMASLVHSIVIPALDGRTWKTAIVVDNPIQFGVSRQYQVFAESYSRDAVFGDRDAALAWLLGPGA